MKRGFTLLATLAVAASPALAAPLASVRQVVAGATVETELRIEGPRLVAHVRGAQGDAWALELQVDGPRLGPASANANGGNTSALCDGLLDASVAVDDRGTNNPSRVLVSAAWRAAARWRSTVLALELGPPGTARVVWQHDSTTLPALGRVVAAPTFVRLQRPEDDLAVVAGGWPLDPTADASHAGGDVLAFSASTGRPLPTVFHAQASLVSGITAVDVDADGTTDRLYFADAAWRVWRLDRDGSGGHDVRFTNLLLADLAALAVSGAALQFAPDVTLAVGGDSRWLDVTLGSSDAPSRAAARHWLFVLHDRLPGASMAPIRAADLRRIDAVATSGADGSERGLLLALDGALAAPVMTVAGRRIIVTRLAKHDRCALHVTDADEPVLVTTVTTPAGQAMTIATTTVPARAGARLALHEQASGNGPLLECSLGDTPLTVCPSPRTVTRDYWVRKDAP